MAVKGKDVSTYLNQSEENLYYVRRNLEDLSSQIDDLYSATVDMDVPEDISMDAKTTIKDGLNDLRSYINGKLKNNVDSLGNSISNAKKSAASISP